MRGKGIMRIKIETFLTDAGISAEAIYLHAKYSY